MNWRDFEAAAPELAALGLERFRRTGVALLGTIRHDGSPRISPVEPYFIEGHLLFGVMRSAKATDLQRDPRCVLHSSVSDPNGTEGEFKLFGRAAPVTNPALRDASSDAWWTPYPSEVASVFSMEIESAWLVEWKFTESTSEVTRWSPDSGLRRSQRRYP